MDLDSNQESTVSTRSSMLYLRVENLSKMAPSLSLKVLLSFKLSMEKEEEGFEPPELSLSGFQDRRLKPLGHSSKNGDSLGSQELWANHCALDACPNNTIQPLPSCVNLGVVVAHN